MTLDPKTLSTAPVTHIDVPAMPFIRKYQCPECGRSKYIRPTGAILNGQHQYECEPCWVIFYLPEPQGTVHFKEPGDHDS